MAELGNPKVGILAVQYLEPGPHVPAIHLRLAREKLRAALDVIPISHVLVGWNLPHQLVDACSVEARRSGANLFLWHPLLTLDGALKPAAFWRTVGLAGEKVPGYQNLPEFTFVCPNRVEAREQILEHLSTVLGRADYDGVFLDRIRFPSPSKNPSRLLACFCEACQAAAHGAGLDLELVRLRAGGLLSTPQGSQDFLRILLGAGGDRPGPDEATLEAFLSFRQQRLAEFVTAAICRVHEAGLAVGLDCFSPALTRMVGQDLRALGSQLDHKRDWIKIMTYLHANGPAGLPFEIQGLCDWLMDVVGMSEEQALEKLSRWLGLPLPFSRKALRERGLVSESLRIETARAREIGVRNLLLGIELVDIDGVAELDEVQIVNDLGACTAAAPDGLVLSWDLWHIPARRLGLVKRVWLSSRRNLDESAYLG